MRRRENRKEKEREKRIGDETHKGGERVWPYSAKKY
jgi:hypothetical protein